MTVSILHAFVSSKGDPGDTTLIKPSNWNAQHVLQCAGNSVLGNSGAATANVAELPATAFGLSLLAATDAPSIGAMPTGAILDFAGSAAPSGYLLCGGQAVSRTTYAALFGVIGTTYGAGDGSTTFNVPDVRGRATAGKDDMGGTAANRLTSGGSGIAGTTLGATGGVETVILSIAQIPAHNHAGSTVAITDPGHSHTTDVPATFSNLAIGSGGPPQGPTNATHTYASTTNTTGITATPTIASQGGGGAHTNTQPTIVFNKIIKT